MVPIVIAAKAHVSNILFTWFKNIPQALAVLQIPTESGGVVLDTPEMVNAIHKLGLKVCGTVAQVCALFLLTLI